MAFYWQHARDSLLTARALQIFQLACAHDGEDFEAAKHAIDDEFAQLRGEPSQRHGGNFQTFVQVFQEAGWITTDTDKLVITPSGRQARLLLTKLPDFLKVAPYFLLELLARYDLNNPAKPETRKGLISDEIRDSNVFPYWTIWKIMRSCDNMLTTAELRRFVLRVQHFDEIDACIANIHAFRADLAAGMPQEDLDVKYSPPLQGAVGESKYIMARAGLQLGKTPPVMLKPDVHTFLLNEDYVPFIDFLLSDEPIHRDYETVVDWFADYSRPVTIGAEVLAFVPPDDATEEHEEQSLKDDDRIVAQVNALIADGSRSLMLSGVPGTSKTWYARRLAQMLVQGQTNRVFYTQFHPSYGYDDFVEGFVPEPSPSGMPQFRLVPKIFYEAASLARSGGPVVLVIDEFTRGDAGRIFGEILTYLEPEYRNKWFRLATGGHFMVPRDLYVIATMNPYDRSVSDVDIAMERRFDWITLKPNAGILRDILEMNGMDPPLIDKVVAFFLYCQDKIPFGGLGHANFLRARDKASLGRVWSNKLEVILERLLRYDIDTFYALQAEFSKVLAD